MGTVSVRVSIFDRAGLLISFATQEYHTSFPKPGWAEQDPDEWWAALRDSVGEALEKGGVGKKEIVALGVDGTSSTVVLLDKEKNHMRKAILWMDNRAAREARSIFEMGHPALKRTLAGMSAEWMISKLLWLKNNEARLFDEAAWFMEQVDWINYMLTGELTLSINHITHRWFYNAREGGWPSEFYASIGLEGITHKFPERIVPVGEVIGKLEAHAGEALGLQPGTVVSQGGCDAYIGMLGLNVVKPGRAALIGGSSHLIMPVTDENMNIKGIFGAHPDCLIPGLYVLEGGQVSTGSIIKWFRDNFTKEEELEARNRGISHYDVLNEKATEVGIGSEGLIVLDYWQGNRTPYTDYMVQGAIWGLTLKHGTGHIFRAIMEGVAYGIQNIVSLLQENGLALDAMYAGGGVTKSELWMKIHADVSNIPIYVPEVTEATVLGSAICASVGAGMYGSLVEASDGMVKVDRVIEPDRENHEKYAFYFDKYRRTYFALRDLMYEMSKRNANGF
jgi:FGGY-family pentulose kinase